MTSPHSTRREFLHFMGRTSLLIGSGTLLLSEIACTTTSSIKGLPFTPLKPTSKDGLFLADGFKSEILIKAYDAINERENFGTDNDFLAFTAFPNKKEEGILWVNHEYLSRVLFHKRSYDVPRTKEEMLQEQLQVGGSLLHIKQNGSSWNVVKNSPYNRRLTAQTMIPFEKGYTIMGSTRARGTLANCAGGQTTWNTILTCEENYDYYYGDAHFENKKRSFVEGSRLKWWKEFPLPPEHYGWVVEVDPFTGQAVKRNALGRFPHEGAKFQRSARGYPVVYMGEDRKGGYIFKFVSSVKTSLARGTLYVADTEKGRWIPLDIKKTPALKKHFNNQQEVLTYAHYAGSVVGATPQHRPEDIEIDPIEGNIFVALTNNPDENDAYGSILKIMEKDGDYEALEFSSATHLPGGLKNGFASPDNMVFDKLGNLWFTVDMDDVERAKGKYEGLGNNGLFYAPLRGAHAGKAFQVASAPNDAEFTGPLFSEDYKTLFLSVQHPGENTTDPAHPTSQWPDGPGTLPKSSVIMITGPALDALMHS